jgi:endonuclease III related protein
MTPKDKTRKQLMAMYRALFRSYGPQRWWPGDSPFEMMVGAVLTQNTAWTNVEKAIANLKRDGPLTAARLRRLALRRIAALIRPSGYYNIKARRLAHLTEFLAVRYGGSPLRMRRADPEGLRKELLTVHGIGPETADSIMLYAVGHPVFVVDTYTRRIFGRHGLVTGDDRYHHVQRKFLENLPHDARLFNEYHALIVRIGKEHCRKTAPRCSGCPLEPFPHEAHEDATANIKKLKRPSRPHKI